MSNSYSWVITEIQCYPEFAGNQNVVFQCHWTRKATDGVGHTAESIGVQSIAFNPADTFIPFDQLTQVDVELWLEEAMGAEMLAALNASLDQQIANQLTSQVISPALPWSQNS